MPECASRGGVCSGGCLRRVGGGVCSQGVSALGGVSAPGGWVGVIPACTEAEPLPCEQNNKQVQKYYLGHNLVAAGN